MSTNTVDNKKKVTTATLAAMKARGEKIAMITAYDYTMATLVDRGGIDMILVGDSAANVMAGYKTTLPITLDQMIYHASCVVRGVQRAFVVCDMPFGSYQGNPDHALASAVRILKESGAEAVKLEGGKEVLASVEAIVRAGIPVMGHLGKALTSSAPTASAPKRRPRPRSLSATPSCLRKPDASASSSRKFPPTLPVVSPKPSRSPSSASAPDPAPTARYSFFRICSA